MIRPAALVLALLLAGCTGGTQVAGPSPSPAGVVTTSTPTAAPIATTQPTVEATDSPEPAGPKLFKAGETIEITNNDEPWAEVVISKVRQVKKYEGDYLDDKPAKGNVYIELIVTYTALDDGVDYNPFDWQVFVGGQAVDSYAFVSEGPQPDLGSGTLPKGRKASGYLVYEVPTRGQVLMSYGGQYGDPPVFEVEIRAS